jgi:membrane protein DedA with SNARE-associated domain
MSLLPGSTLSHLIIAYGYWAVFGLVALESSGIPLPGETALISAAVYAGTTRRIDIALVILAAAGGAILGDNIGFRVGREFGIRLLVRYGRYARIDAARLKLGQYLFLRHGAKIVFFGRFVAVLRAFAALLAGANRMRWRRFLVSNACGGAVWAMLYGLGGYVFGEAAQCLARPVGIAALVLVAAAFIAGLIMFRRHEKALAAQAERALPGPLAPLRRRIGGER